LLFSFLVFLNIFFQKLMIFFLVKVK
jgi:hypothetical protein